MELLEREQLLGDLETILSDVTDGNGRFVMVSGEAGIGKTSLVERFTETNQNQARVFWGACDSLFTARPLGPLYDIANQSQSRLLALLDEEASRAAIFNAAIGELAQGRAPTIVVIEDVHWADEATLDLLKFLGRRISKTTSMLIVTYRDDEVGPDHPLRLVFGDLPNRSVARIRLVPLSRGAVDKLAERAGRQVENLFAVTGGNPFFVTEALASKESGVPVTVFDAVTSRAARLSPQARALLELVSVIPSRAEMSLLNEAKVLDRDALEECLVAGVLRSEGDAVAFRHELARLAIEESIPAPRRQSLNAVVLKAMLNRGSEPFLPQIVHHACQAGDGAAVLKYAPEAARKAAALNAHRQAASHYERALRYADSLTPKERAGLFECRSYECYLTDQMEEAAKARRKALDIWKELGDDCKLGDNLRWMSRLTWYLGKKTEAETYSSQAVSILEKLPPGPELAMAYSNRAQLHMLADETQEAVLWGERAIELAEKLGATDTLVHALNNVGTAELLASNERGRAKLEESLRLALENNFEEHAARAFTNLGSAAVRERNYRLAKRYQDDGIVYTSEHDLDSWKLYMVGWRARVHFEQGNWDGAADDAELVLRHHKVSAITRISALSVLGHLRVRRGDPDAARILNEAQELAMKTKELQRIAPVATALAEAAWLKGDHEKVISEARAVLEMAKDQNDPWLQGEFAFWMWRAGSGSETIENIAAPYALQMSGDWRAAAEAWKEIGCPYDEAVALTFGDERAQREALEIFEQLGAGPAAERLRQALRATGVRGIPRGPRSSTKENPAGLTNRQVEVLELMAKGLGNNEIGEHLFISTRTVDHHVSTILSKLDAHTRAEAVSLALQRGLIKQK